MSYTIKKENKIRRLKMLEQLCKEKLGTGIINGMVYKTSPFDDDLIEIDGNTYDKSGWCCYPRTIEYDEDVFGPGYNLTFNSKFVLELTEKYIRSKNLEGHVFDGYARLEPNVDKLEEIQCKMDGLLYTKYGEDHICIEGVWFNTRIGKRVWPIFNLTLRRRLEKDETSQPEQGDQVALTDGAMFDMKRHLLSA